MAEDTEKKASEKPAAKAAASGGDDKISRERLISNARDYFRAEGGSPALVAGALHGNDAEELTLDEVRAAIEKFRTQEVSA